jgi:hypothetical protein
MKNFLSLVMLMISMNVMGQKDVLMKLYIPAEKQDIEVSVHPVYPLEGNAYAGNYVNEREGIKFTIRLGTSGDKLTASYESKGGPSDASFDYFNPYIEKDVLYAEMLEFRFVRLTYSINGKDVSRTGLLEADKYFYEKQ